MCRAAVWHRELLWLGLVHGEGLAVFLLPSAHYRKLLMTSVVVSFLLCTAKNVISAKPSITSLSSSSNSLGHSAGLGQRP